MTNVLAYKKLDVSKWYVWYKIILSIVYNTVFLYKDVFTYGACCSAPSLSCHVRKSSNGGVHQGDTSSVSCDSGETMVSCSVYSEDGNTAGAYPSGSFFVFVQIKNNVSTARDLPA